MKTLAKVLIVVGVFVIAIAAGFGWRDMAQARAPELSRLPMALLGKAPPAQELAPTRVFSEVLANIENNFYGKVDKRGLTYAGVSGMISALKDPHTMLLEPDLARQFQEKSHGEFVGIGAELTPDPLGARIRRVFRRSPAEEAGIKPNDVITKVAGRLVIGRDLQSVVHDIRGEAGTYVRLDIFRESAKQNLQIRVARRQVFIQDVYGEILPTNPPIGKLEVRSYSETIVSQFDNELQAIEDKGIKGLIIDLRGNPGGLLGAAVDMAGRFIDNKKITSMKKRDSELEASYSPSGLTAGRRYPVVILIDENTASAAEIFAGAMRDYQLATLVGQNTYGKGSVQVIRPLADGAQLKLTVARYFLPRGETVQRREDENGNFLSGGLEPDVAVKRSRDFVAGDLKKDNQLKKAVEVMLSKLR